MNNNSDASSLLIEANQICILHRPVKLLAVRQGSTAEAAVMKIG